MSDSDPPTIEIGSARARGSRRPRGPRGRAARPASVAPSPSPSITSGFESVTSETPSGSCLMFNLSNLGAAALPSSSPTSSVPSVGRVTNISSPTASLMSHASEYSQNISPAMSHLTLVDPSETESQRGDTSVSGGSVVAGSTVGSTVSTQFTKKGTKGTPLKVITNYFLMNDMPTFNLIQYRVDFTPVEDTTDAKKKMMRALEPFLGSFVFDGHMLYKTEYIAEQNLELQAHLGEPPNQKSFTINLRPVGIVKRGDAMYLQFFNIVMRTCMSKMGMEELGRHFYDRRKSIQFPADHLELWPGVITAIRNHQAGTLLCAEITHKVLRRDTVADILERHRDKNAQGSTWSLNGKKRASEEIIGTIIITHYNRKTYKIDGIDWDATPSTEFTLQDGQNISYRAYYFRRYKLDIPEKYNNFPMIWSEAKKKDINRGVCGNIYLVPGLANCTGLTDDMRKNFPLMKRLSTHLHMEPTDRKQKLDNFMDQLTNVPEVQEVFKGWNINFNPGYLEAVARIMPKENIYLGVPGTGGESIAVKSDDNFDWTFQYKNYHALLAAPLQNWVLFVPKRYESSMVDLIRSLQREARQVGMNLNPPTQVVTYQESSRNMDFIQQAWDRHNGKIELMFFVLANNQLSTYSAIKKECTLKLGIPSQCFLVKNLNKERSLGSICRKIMIQITAKLAGEPWGITVPTKRIMVLGFDVYHCSERKNESVGALIASTSDNLTKYFSTVSFHAKKEELATNLCADTMKCLLAYHKTNNGALPTRIFLFRDGVGEGQVNYVVEHEVRQIMTGVIDVYQKYGVEEPKFTFIIVTKKINTRAMVQEVRGRYKNPPSGTVIDDVVTLPERYDFFLVSQCVNQRTVSPTNYNVVHDTSGLQPDQIQRLAYKMCHMYFNWSGTVAVPAPCQYAHKLAYLTGMALNAQAPPQLSNTLWYL